MATEKVGGIEMGADIELDSFENSIRTLNKMVQSVDANAKGAEKSFMGLEKGTKAAAGSIEALQQRARVLRQQMEKLDPDTKKFTETAKNLNVVLTELKYAKDKAAKASVAMAGGMDKAGLGARALGITLGMLGAQSIEAVIFKMVQLGRESIDLAINLEGLESRAKAIYGDAFPQMEREFDALAQSTRRSASDLMEFGTGFAYLLDSVGMSADSVRVYSKELTELTVKLGKAHPGKTDAEAYQIMEAAILGNARGLKALGVTMKDKQLQDFAEKKNYPVKFKNMTEEQLMYVRTQYLLEETTKQQQAAEAMTGKLGDTSKTTSAAWKDMLEEFGQDASPVVNAVLGAIARGLQALMQAIGSVRQNWDLMMREMAAGQFQNRTQDGVRVIDYAKPGFKAANEAAMAGNRETLPPAAGIAGGGFPSGGVKGGRGGGGENKALEEAKKIAAEIEKIEKNVLETQGKIAKENLDRQTQLREELLLKKKLGVLTKEEAKTLDRLNTRVEFAQDKVKDLTDAWEKQVDVVKNAREEVEKINDEIQKGRAGLDETLKGIDEDTLKKKGEKIADLLDEQKKINEETKRNNGVTPEQTARLAELDKLLSEAKGGKANDQREINDLKAELRELQAYAAAKDASGQANGLTAGQRDRAAAINTRLTGLTGAADNSAAYARGEQLASADDLTRIDIEAGEKKRQAVLQYNKDLEKSVLDLAEAERKLAEATAAEARKKTDVLDAVAAVRAGNDANYPAMNASTQLYVQNEIAQYDRLVAKLAEVKAANAGIGAKLEDPFGVGAVKRAAGGPVFGPGGPTADKVPAWLSNGEFVVNARAYQQNRDLVHAINSGLRLSLPRFAQGGPVSHSVSTTKTAHVTNHFHGDSARAVGAHTWHALRGAMR